jgi:hypothetical protein
MNRSYSNFTGLSPEIPIYPAQTMLYLSRNAAINKLGYYFYEPVHLFLNNQGFATLIYDPRMDVIDSPRTE